MEKASDLELVGGRLCLDFANTIGNYLAEPREERLTDYGELVAWCRHAGIVDDGEARQLARVAARQPADAEAAVARARELRDAIFDTFFAIANDRRPPPRAIDLLNASLGEALGAQQLVRDGDGWALRCAADTQLDSPLRPIARSAAELLVDRARHERLRVCGGAEHDCTWLFVDESKNGKRRWCSMRDCGNRAKARRHYERTHSV
ncbi:MAG: CGNR zinc finger domain-containing protein [Acidobacteriota bacterium]